MVLANPWLLTPRLENPLNFVAPSYFRETESFFNDMLGTPGSLQAFHCQAHRKSPGEWSPARPEVGGCSGGCWDRKMAPFCAGRRGHQKQKDPLETLD